MIKVYLIDAQRVCVGTLDVCPTDPLPPNARLAAPPLLTGLEVAQWREGGWGARLVDGSPKVERHEGGWVVLPGYPEVLTPPVPVPQSVTMRQARLALLQAGLLVNVDAAIDALPSPQKEAARIEWDYSSEVWRDKPFVQQLGAALGLDEAALDAMFIAAAAL